MGSRTHLLVWSVMLLALSTWLSVPGASAEVAQSSQDLLDEYDYIIIGGGTAGLTVGDRLTESGNYTVLVIEHGYLDSSDSILAVTTPDVAEAGPDEYPDATRYYNTTTVPQYELDGQRKLIRAGCVVGGSSAVNGMLIDRGSAEDYDNWVEAAGEFGQEYAAEWGWENFLPWFKKSVTFHPPDQGAQNDFGITYDAEAAYGGDTPIHASYRPYQWPTQQLMFNALKQIPGIESPREAADGSKYGVLWAPNSMDATNHTRSYAKLGHFDAGPISRETFHLLAGHRVTRIHVESVDDDETWVATGVDYVPRGGVGDVASVKARKEVIVSAGTMHTPQILERSGIGPRPILEAADVPVKVELPGVGYNFQSHTSITVSFRFTKDIFPTEADLLTNRTFRAEAQRQWDTDKTGPYATQVNSGAFLPFSVFSNRTEAIISMIEDQSPSEFLPEGIDPTIVRGYALQREILIRQLRSTKSAWLESLFFGQSSLGAILLHIFSRGTVHIAANDDGLRTDPVIDYRAFTNPVDLELNVELLKGVRWFMGHEAMVEAVGPVETSPRVTDEDDIKSWIRRTVNANVAHQVGTSSLGPLELGGVVGPDLRVHGVQHLSVADNSIMPLVIGSHTSATAYAIGEKAADLIKRRA